MRKDAEENRDRLIAVAADAMRNEGGDVPFEVIAERAGVSRPTLYRNFPDRQAMYEAVLEQDLSRLSEKIARDATADPAALLRHTAEMTRAYDKFLSRLVEMPDYRSKENQDRMANILAGPLVKAQECGALHEDLTPGDVLIACRMLGSHWKLDGAPEFEQVFERRLGLMMRGIAGKRPSARRKLSKTRSIKRER